MSITIKFAEIYCYITVYHYVNGKRKQFTRKFYQTDSPFNEKGGRRKTRQEIKEEVEEEAFKYVSEILPKYSSKKAASYTWRKNY